MKPAGTKEREAAAEALRRELAEIVVDFHERLDWDAEAGELRPRTPDEERKLPPLVLPGRAVPAPTPARAADRAADADPASVAMASTPPVTAPTPVEAVSLPMDMDLLPSAHEPEPCVDANDCPDLASLEAALRGCQRCKLAEGRHNLVFGEGNPSSDLLLVGEAPGYHEDRTGRAFVGPAGELLDRILAAVQIRREDIFICNIVKCRPPGNRDPRPDEIKACGAFVRRQIELVAPKLILGLGRVAAQSLLATRDPVGRLRGRFYDLDGIPFLPTYHPAALLRDAKYKRPVWEDMQMLKSRLEELT